MKGRRRRRLGAETTRPAVVLSLFAVFLGTGAWLGLFRYNTTPAELDSLFVSAFRSGRPASGQRHSWIQSASNTRTCRVSGGSMPRGGKRGLASLARRRSGFGSTSMRTNVWPSTSLKRRGKLLFVIHITKAARRGAHALPRHASCRTLSPHHRRIYGASPWS